MSAPVNIQGKPPTVHVGQYGPPTVTHNMFHANLLMPYKETELHGPNYTWPPPDLVDGEQEFKVEKILDAQQRGQGCKLHFLVKWKGYPMSDNLWEKAEDVHAEELVQEFYAQRKTNKDKARK
jgi:hypothetical protein